MAGSAIGVAGIIASLYAANQQSNAATDASGAQIGASKDALAQQQKNFETAFQYAQNQYKQQRADQAPWLSYGRGAVTMLGDLMGVKPNNSPDVAGTTPPSGDPNTYEYSPGGPPGGRYRQVPPGGAQPVPIPPGSNLDLLTLKNPYPDQDPGQIPPGPIQPRSGAASTVGGSTVRISWPDGSTNEVDAKDLPQYQQLGAQVAH